jgi:glycosyltransferase involved in cell wall biosynthesis
MWISYNSNRIITAASSSPLEIEGEKAKKINIDADPRSLVGKTAPIDLLDLEDFVRKDSTDLRVAMVCNWHTKCGISTYSSYLVDALRPKVKELRIFSEIVPSTTAEDGPEVDRCWERGKCLIDMCKRVKDWSPDFVIIQHEFGIFPNAFYFMQMMQQFENIPHVVVMHSVYQHLDKVVYSECVRNIVCHTEKGRDMLKSMGNTNNIYVIPHGCVVFDDAKELWNINHNPYTVMQFGFGFAYKGVERALEAIHILKTSDPKFSKIMYFYLISENDFNSKHHLDYYRKLLKKIDELGLQENVALYRKYQTEQNLNLYLRLAKLAIFPYLNSPDNTVFGASGASRIAMANKIPVVVSESHLFDDLEGVLPRPSSASELAKTIDEVFSNGTYRQAIIDKSQQFIRDNAWDKIADKYLDVYGKVSS